MNIYAFVLFDSNLEISFHLISKTDDVHIIIFDFPKREQKINCYKDIIKTKRRIKIILIKMIITFANKSKESIIMFLMG